MRRRDLAIGLLLSTVMPLARAQDPTKRHRIAIVEVGSLASIDDPDSRLWQPFWKELRRLGDVDGQNLVIGRYSGEGHLERYDNLAREVAGYNPDVIVVLTNPMTQAIRAANRTTPIVMFGGSVIEPGLATSPARPGGNLTGVDGYPGDEIHGKPEKATGARPDRCQLNRMLGKLAPGDVVSATRIDRLARSTLDLFGIVKRIVGCPRPRQHLRADPRQPASVASFASRMQ